MKGRQWHDVVKNLPYDWKKCSLGKTWRTTDGGPNELAGGIGEDRALTEAERCPLWDE